MRNFAIGGALLVAGFLALNLVRGGTATPAEIGEASVPDGVKRAELTVDETEIAGQYAAERFHTGASSRALPPSLKAGAAAVYVAARANGDRLYWVWRRGESAEAALNDAVDDLKEKLGDRASKTTTLEMNFAHSFRTIDPKSDRRRITNVFRGLRGIEILKGDRVTRYAPTEMLAMNIDFTKAMQRYAEKEGVSLRVLESAEYAVRIFEADQVLVELETPPRVSKMVRGNTLVDLKDITKQSVQALSEAHSSFLFTNLHDDGRMTYKYWPSRGEESSGNNMIRQWMATVAMGRIAKKANSDEMQARVAKNIDYNISQFYEEDAEGHGQIVEDKTKVKLGAVALAALGMFEHPERARWARHETALQKTIDSLWRDDGEMISFFRPKLRNDNQNFYPGEALLYWASLYEQSRDDVLLDRFMKSMRYYKTWHLNNRNPAFIPWHTQAYYKVWTITKSDELKDWLFEMNDWLLGVQQWDDQKNFPDTMGRFHDPKRPFGPPHSSSTGVYLEGLIDAWRMAKEVGDKERQEKYRTAIMRGLRSVTQLTYLDNVDMFYITKRDRMFGGVRTTVYDNEVRVDNIQHNLMGILKILEHMGEEEFHP